MNIEISKFLRNMVQNEGSDYLLEETKVSSYLADIFPEFKRERNILRMSMRMGYSLKLEQSIKKLGFNKADVVIRKLEQELCDEGCITHEAARYALNTIAYARGYVQEFIEPEAGDGIDSGFFEYLNEKVNLLEKENQVLQEQNEILQKKLYEWTASNYGDTTKWQHFIKDDDITLAKTIIEKNPELMMKCGKFFLTSQNIKIVTLGEYLLLCAAENENAEAQRLLGELYYENKDEEKAYIYFQQSVGNGDVNAAYKLGIMCGMSGRYTDAAKWFRIASEGGVAEAQLQYGILLQSGIGVEKNLRLALYYFQKSANAGNKIAMEKYYNLLRTIKK